MSIYKLICLPEFWGETGIYIFLIYMKISKLRTIKI